MTFSTMIPMKFASLITFVTILTGCVTPDAAQMTLGANGKYKTAVKKWQNNIVVDAVKGGDRAYFSGKSFHQALQQTLVNVGFSSPELQGELNLQVQVLDTVGARLAMNWAGTLRTHYTLRSSKNEILLSENIDSMCFSSATIPADPKFVMEDCGRQNIKSLLMKLEVKGQELSREPAIKSF